MFSKIFDLFVNFILKIILNKIIFGIITTLVSFSIYFGVQGTLWQLLNFLEIIIGIDTWIGSLNSKLIIFFNNLNSQQIKSWLCILTFLTFINYSNKKLKEWNN